MSDIYCHEDVMDFTNPFLDFDQGYHAPRPVVPVVPAMPVSPKSVLLTKPLTRRGYPRGETQGDSLGELNFPPS